ncbi:MAG: glycerol-3-phosphate dehydrogenase [Woeseiaceae bacterium]|nr:glycerol-3-phosphate dehydrogenase [Woeseiaceae bacterium]
MPSSGRAGASSSFDVIVIGGGINGAGIARDAALRGLRTLLLEARDFGSGTSSWSTRLIHGGLRYLEYGELSLVRESLGERRRLRQHAPHLVRPIAMTIPVYRSARRGKLLIRLGMMAYDLLSMGKELPRHSMLSRKALIAALPGINTAGLVGGARYFDAQVTFAERLVIENLLAAADAGASLRNYAAVTRLETEADGSFRVRFDGAGAAVSATASVVVNAAGPWVDQVLSRAEQALAPLMGGTKGSHAVVGEFPGAPRHAVYVEAEADGRPVFVIPWNGQYLIGTTDLRYDGDPGEARASREEIDYLLGETNRLFPDAGLGADELHFAYSGVRPLPRQEEGPESAITRRHIIHEHDGKARGLISIIGGKLTTYRSLAEQTVDRIEKRLGRQPASCPTRDAALPGARGCDRIAKTVTAFDGLSPAGRRRLADVYGGRVSRLAELVADDDAHAQILDDDGTVLAGEVALAIRDEFAVTLTDIVYRRLMVGLSPRLGDRLVSSIARVAQRELGWDAATLEAQVVDLNRWNERLRRPRNVVS